MPGAPPFGPTAFEDFWYEGGLTAGLGDPAPRWTWTTMRLGESPSFPDVAEASERASRLLSAHLSEQQLTSWRRHRHFHVRGSMGGTYRISWGVTYNIALESKGMVLAKYCIRAAIDALLPMQDQILAQKLLIEADELRFLTVANCTTVEIGPWSHVDCGCERTQGRHIVRSRSKPEIEESPSQVPGRGL